jgi:WD40 repeat protein
MTTGSDGSLYTWCNSDIVWVWNKAKLVDYLVIKSSPISAIVVGPHDQVISSHRDDTIKVWRTIDKNRPSCTKVMNLPTKVGQMINMFHWLNYNSRSLYRNDAAISCLCLSEDKRFVYSGSWDHTVKVWRLRDWWLLEWVESIKGHTQEEVNTIATGSSRLLFSGSNDGSIRLFRRVEGKRREIVLRMMKWLPVLTKDQCSVELEEPWSRRDVSYQSIAGRAEGAHENLFGIS